jgi:hypothetical protein
MMGWLDRRATRETRWWRLLVLAALPGLASLLLRCASPDTQIEGTDASVADSAAVEAPAAPNNLGTDLDASLAPARFDCLPGCPPDGGDCTDLLGACTCSNDAGCTGGPGVSIAICPYGYRYCVGLGTCVTRARYYAQCPY